MKKSFLKLTIAPIILSLTLLALSCKHNDKSNDTNTNTNTNTNNTTSDYSSDYSTNNTSSKTTNTLVENLKKQLEQFIKLDEKYYTTYNNDFSSSIVFSYNPYWNTLTLELALPTDQLPSSYTVNNIVNKSPNVYEISVSNSYTITLERMFGSKDYLKVQNISGMSVDKTLYNLIFSTVDAGSDAELLQNSVFYNKEYSLKYDSGYDHITMEFEQYNTLSIQSYSSQGTAKDFKIMKVSSNNGITELSLVNTFSANYGTHATLAILKIKIDKSKNSFTVVSCDGEGFNHLDLKANQKFTISE